MKYKGYQVGDKVWCTVMRRNGIIKDIKINGYDTGYITRRNVIEVTTCDFDEIELQYHTDGRLCEDYAVSLFVIGRKPTEEDVVNEYNRLIKDVPEVQFTFGDNNYAVEFLGSLDSISAFSVFHTNVKHLNYKYMTEENTLIIANKLRKFIKGE